MKKQHLKVLLIVIGMVCIFWIHPTFAADGAATTTTSDPSRTRELFSDILRILSFGWMILAFLAGKLMSNDFIYGTFIHLDSALFKLWNYMKNIANFTLGFLFLFGILKTFFTGDAFELKKVLPRYLLAGVLIQMSWFIMGAFVDLANIATAAVGSFPQQFIQGSTEDLSKSKMMQLAVTVPEKIEVSFQANQPLIKTYTGSQTIEEMFGKFNNMSGPLMFIGSSIFRFQDYDIMNQDVSSTKNFTIGLILKLFLLIAFCVPLLVLVVINLMRIFKLWIRISFSPLAAISWAFDKETPGFIKETGDKLGFGKLGDVLGLIFQPVAMIGSLSLVLILSIGMFYVLGGDPGDQKSSSNFSKTFQDIRLDGYGDVSTLTDLNSGTEISVEGDLFKGVDNFVGGMIGYLILTGFTVVLIRSLIKISASFSKFTDKTASNIFSWSEKLVSTAPLIPIGGSFASFGGMKQAADQTTKYLTTDAYAAERVDAEASKLTTNFFSTNYGKTLKKTFGIADNIGDYDISNAQKSSLMQISGGSIDTVLKALRDSMEKKKVTAQSRNFRDSFNALIGSNPKFREFMLKGAGITTDEYDKDKANILGDGATGAKMRKFLAYALNNPDIKEGVTMNSKIDEDILKKFKTSSILPNTPLVPDSDEQKEQK